MFDHSDVHICYTYCTFYGSDKQKVIDFRDILSECIKKGEMENDFGKAWFGNVLDSFGLYYKNYTCEGEIRYICNEISEKKDNKTGKMFYSFNIEYIFHYPSGKNVYQTWDMILQCFNARYNADIQQAFLTKEIYIDLYEKHDPTGLFYPEQYSVNFFNDTDEDSIGRNGFLQNSVEDTVTLISDVLKLIDFNLLDASEVQKSFNIPTMEQIEKQYIPKPEYPEQHSCKTEICIHSAWLKVFWIAQI